MIPCLIIYLLINIYRFDYSESSDNEDNKILDPNVTTNVNDDDKMIPPVFEFGDVFGLVLLFL